MDEYYIELLADLMAIQVSLNYLVALIIVIIMFILCFLVYKVLDFMFPTKKGKEV